jgi:hypothetical protein
MDDKKVDSAGAESNAADNKEKTVVVPPAPEIKKEGERDYKVELEAAKKELGQAQHTIIKLKGEKKEEAVIEDEEKPKEDIDEKLEKFKAEQAKDTLEDELARLTDDPNKQELIRLHYDKRIVKTGFDRKAIKTDLADALAIVDKPRHEKTISELKQANISNKTKNTSGSAAGQDTGGNTGETREDQLTPKDKQVMARAGITLKDVNNNKK